MSNKYDSYKYSGVEWIGDIPSHWKLKQLKHLVHCNKDSLAENTNPETEIKYIEIGDVSSIDGIKATTVYPFETAPSRARRIVKEGDVLISTVRTYLKAITSITANFDGCIASTGFAVLTPKLINSGFLGKLVLNEGFIGEIISLSKGVSYPSITASDLTNITIPLPEWTEQTAIANFLDHKTAQIDDLIAKKERLIQLLEEERTAIINQAVTKGLDPNVPMKDSGIEWLGEVPGHWEVKKLKYFLQIQSGKGITNENLNPEGEFAVWGGNGIMGYTDDFSSDGIDLIIGRVGALCGNVHLVKGRKWISDNALFARTEENENFIEFFLKFLDLNRLANKNAQPLITGTMVKEQIICLPNYQEQTDIVSYINFQGNRISALSSSTKKEIEFLKEYKTALISEVVTGKVDVRNEKLN